MFHNHGGGGNTHKTCNENNNNSIIFYRANIQFDKNLFSAVCKFTCVQARTLKLKIAYILTIDLNNTVIIKTERKKHTYRKTMVIM